MAITRLCGHWPITHAVNATETVIDFIERGGTLMMRRLQFPLPHARERVGEGLNVPVVPVGRARLERRKAALDEGYEIGPKDRLEKALAITHAHLHCCRTRSPGHFGGRESGR